jgi:hypothetical protein
VKTVSINTTCYLRDYGESSITLLCTHVGIIKERPGIPWDAADWRRCEHMMDCLELDDKGRLKLMHDLAFQYDEWKPFYANYERLAAFQTEAALGKLISKIWKEWRART